MRHYNLEFKEMLLKKVFDRPQDVSVSKIARDHNIPNETLFGWIRKSESGGIRMSKSKYSRAQKFTHCIEYFSLPESQRGEYLRSNGLYSYELDKWKKEFIDHEQSTVNKADKTSKQRIKELERELRRKEKALAETATLLTLKKKYQEIFEDEE